MKLLLLFLKLQRIYFISYYIHHNDNIKNTILNDFIMAIKCKSQL